MKHDTSARVCIIGAGPCGITAAKNCLEAGLTNVVVYEKGDQIGGNWVYDPNNKHSSVYETTHIISSRRLSQFDDYPMPEGYPDYPSHQQLYDYFNGYADHFGVRKVIQFKTEVNKVEKQADETWKITLKGGKVETFDYLMVANGHHWDPRYHIYPGKFSGKMLHSHEYKKAEPFRNKRVLVIGGGNSGCDIAVETSRISAFTAISLRRGYYFAPKFMAGQPADVINLAVLWAPRWLRLFILRIALKLAVGEYHDYGLPDPDYGLLRVHQTVNTDILHMIRHGKIHPRKDVAKFDGKNVQFVDGSVEPYDVVIAATGFKISFPFFNEQFIDWSEGQNVPLYLRMFHPDHPSLYFIGLVQPLGCIWPLADLHAQLAVQSMMGKWIAPRDMAKRIEREVGKRNAQYEKAARHSIEVDYHEHRKELVKALGSAR